MPQIRPARRNDAEAAFEIRLQAIRHQCVTAYTPEQVMTWTSMPLVQGYFKNGGTAFLFSWFYTKVRNRGDWDYKQSGRQFASFGNFNYGAVGTAAGISETVLLRAAGAAQTVAGTSQVEFDKWWADSPYGDDPVDQAWIKAGIDYAKSQGY